MSETQQPETGSLDPEYDPSQDIDPDGGLYLITDPDGGPAVLTADGKAAICCLLFRHQAEWFLLAHPGFTMRLVLPEDADALQDWVDANSVFRAIAVFGPPSQDATLEQTVEAIRSGHVASLHIPAKTLLQQLRDGMMRKIARGEITPKQRS
jgi:hypothetical protein